MSNAKPISKRWMWCRLDIAVGIATLIAGGIVALRWNTSPDKVVDLALTENDSDAGEQHLRQWIRSGRHADSNVYVALAWLCGRKGAWDEAVALFLGSDLSTCRNDVLLKFADQARRDNRFQLAARALQPLRNRSAETANSAQRMLWEVYRALGMQDEAFTVAREFLLDNPGDCAMRLELVRALKGAFRDAECLDEIQRTLQLDPPAANRRELDDLLLEQFMVLGQFSAAWEQVTALQKRDGNTPQLQAKVIDLYRMEGRLQEAFDAIEKLFPTLKQLPAAWLMRGAILLDMGRHADAVADLEQAVSLEPFNERAQFKLSEAYRGVGQEELSRKHREIGSNIRSKRIRINALIKQQVSETLSSRDCEELAALNREVGAFDAARYWRQRSQTPTR